MCDKKEISLDMPLWNELKINEILMETKKSSEENPFDHDDLTSRIKRTLYYDPLKQPDTDTLSFSVTESAVSRFQHVAPMPGGKLGHRYASRVAREACISPCALLLGLIYIERLKHKNPNYLETISSSDLFLVSMMVASKYLYDEGCVDEVFNDEWATSGDMDVARVNKLEREFLKAVAWHLYVNPQEFSSMLNVAETDIALSNGSRRGWLTYSDLRSLLDSQKICKQLTMTAGILSKATCMCMIMYSGLVCLAALTSTALVSLSNKPYQNQTPFGPQPYRHPSVPEPTGNATDEDSPAVGLASDPQSVDSDEFPGFSESTNEFRLVDRKRVYVIEDTFSSDPQVAPGIMPVMMNETMPDKPDISANLPPSLQLQPSVTDRDSKLKKPICSMLEAVFFMAHVPAICRLERVPERCQNCGKPIVNSEVQDATCGRFRAGEQKVPSNSTIRLNADMHNLRILPRRTPSFPLNKMNSMLGIYNPTLPPILQARHNSGIPIVVV